LAAYLKVLLELQAQKELLVQAEVQLVRLVRLVRLAQLGLLVLLVDQLDRKVLLVQLE
jgi:hypothetical protein